jgi:hypothetical protein
MSERRKAAVAPQDCRAVIRARAIEDFIQAIVLRIIRLYAAKVIGKGK